MVENYPVNPSSEILLNLLLGAAGNGTAEGVGSLSETLVAENTLHSDQEETEERATKYNTFIAIHIHQWIGENINWLYINRPRAAVIVVVKRLSTRVMQSMHSLFSAIFDFYDEGISADARWFPTGTKCPCCKRRDAYPFRGC